MGGVDVYAGDLYGTGQDEIVATEAGAGEFMVAVFTGTGQLLSAFQAFAGTGYADRLNVAVGNVMNPTGGPASTYTWATRPPTAQIIIGVPKMLRRGGIHLQRYYRTSILRVPSQFGGQRDGGGCRLDDPPVARRPGRPTQWTSTYAEIVVGRRRTPLVGVYQLYGGSVVTLDEFFAFDTSVSTNPNGVTVAAGQTDGTGVGQIFVGLVGGSQISSFRGVVIRPSPRSRHPTDYSRVAGRWEPVRALRSERHRLRVLLPSGSTFPTTWRSWPATVRSSSNPGSTSVSRALRPGTTVLDRVRRTETAIAAWRNRRLFFERNRLCSPRRPRMFSRG